MLWCNKTCKDILTIWWRHYIVIVFRKQLKWDYTQKNTHCESVIVLILQLMRGCLPSETFGDSFIYWAAESDCKHSFIAVTEKLHSVSIFRHNGPTHLWIFIITFASLKSKQQQCHTVLCIYLDVDRCVSDVGPVLDCSSSCRQWWYIRDV